MKIQGKLLLLIYGIVIPSLVCIIVFAVLYSGLSHGQYVYDEKTGIGAPWNMHRLIRDVFNRGKDGKDPLASDILLVLDDDGTVHYLNPGIQGIYPGLIDSSQLLKLITTYYTDRGLVFTRYQYRETTGTLIYFSRWLGNVSNRMSQVIPSIILISIFLLVVPALLAMRFVTKLRYSLKMLEDAIISISDGVSNIEIPKDFLTGDFGNLFHAVKMMSSQLKEEEERRSRFFLAVSHDLKTPLTSIKGYLEAIQDGIPQSQKEYEEYISIMKEKADLLEKRILSLIEYAVFDSGKLIQNFLIIDALPFFQTSVKMFKKEAHARHVGLQTVVDFSPDIQIKGNTKLLLRCFENLFDNAVKYSDSEAPHIEISCRSDETNLVYSIRDNGHGIPENEQKHIFEPFYRSDKNRNRPGFGLGLASVKSIVELHNGKISCFNHPAGGAVFMLTIPIYEKTVEENCLHGDENSYD